MRVRGAVDEQPVLDRVGRRLGRDLGQTRLLVEVRCIFDVQVDRFVREWVERFGQATRLSDV
jgi:hypothetical protein